jgi:chromosome segregation ATPase
MSLIKKLTNWFRKEPVEDLTTPEGRHRMIQRSLKELREADQSLEKVETFYEDYSKEAKGWVKEYDRLDKSFQENYEQMQMLRKELQKDANKARQEKEQARQEKEQARQEKELWDSLMKKYQAWESKMKTLGKPSPSNESERKKLMGERQQLEEELLRLEGKSKPSNA